MPDKFMNKPKAADKWERYSKSPTGIKAELASSAFGDDQFEDFVNGVEEKYGENMITLPAPKVCSIVVFSFGIGFRFWVLQHFAKLSQISDN